MLFIPLSVTSAKESPKTLAESIESAIKLNPRTKSTNELLESVEYSVKALRAGMLPSGDIYCNASASHDRSAFGGGPEIKTNSYSTSCGLGVGYTIYDGGAQRYTYRSAQLGKEALDATFNTTDSLIPNTRGGLAQNTKELYVALARVKAGHEYLKFVRDTYSVFTKISNENILLEKIKDIDQEILNMSNNIEDLTEEFLYTVKSLPADDIEDLVETIASLKIPASVEDAIALAHNQGAEVRRRNLNVQMAEFGLKSTKASYGPRVTAGGQISAGRFRYESGLDNGYSASKSVSVGVTISIPLDPSAKHRVRAAEAELASKKSERDAAIQDAEHSLERLYASLEHEQEQYESLVQNYNNQLLYVTDLAEKVLSGKVKSVDVNTLIQDISTLGARYSQLKNTQVSVLNSLFSIQQVSGIIFDALDLQ